MGSTVNFTAAVDGDLLGRAKVVAAKGETSVNALFNSQLRYLVDALPKPWMSAPAPEMPSTQLRPILMPDSGPLITLAHADKLELLLRPGWPLRIADMVLHELTRNATPTRTAIQEFVAKVSPRHS